MRWNLILFVFFLSTTVSAQIVGNITNTAGEPLSYVTIYLQKSYSGTSSNDDGDYSLTLPKTQKYNEYKISFKALGYKTVSYNIAPTSFPYVLNVVLEEETTALDEVVLSSEEDPAYRIIRKTVEKQKENLKNLSEYTAHFYSRGMLKMKNVPEKLFGQKISDFEGSLDSTRSGSIYLAENISEISFQKPDKFIEKIIASNEIGNDNGFRINNAESLNFSFYEDNVVFRIPLLSPIASTALHYYKYKLEGVFYEGSKLINKIQVIPRRPYERVWQGYIYIVENDWQLYGVDLYTTGSELQIPFFNTLEVKQSFKFDVENNFWVKMLQTIEFDFGLLGIDGEGSALGVYSNYNFTPKFDKNSFTNEVISFLPQAYDRDNKFWKEMRPVPLSAEESFDYIRREKIQDLRQTKPYLDSLDVVGNKPDLLSPFFGYKYQNLYEQWFFNYEGLLPVINFNTVQGWNDNVALSFNKWYNKKRTNTLTAKLVGNYGLSEDRFRVNGSVIRVFNQVNKQTIAISGGSKPTQFNDSKPISPIKNTVSTLLYENNHMKLYQLNFAQIAYGQEVFNGLHLYGRVSYENRQPLFNNSDYVFIQHKNQHYTSNDPLAPDNFNSAAIEEHNILKSKFRIKINFAQQYFSNPDYRYSVDNEKYPELNLVVTNGSFPSKKQYEFTQFEGRLGQSVTFGNKGSFSYLFKGGGFVNSDGISFVDFKHFNGDETWLGTTRTYINIFNLLHSYEYSTRQAYFEGHLEHNFRGWILGKIPGINTLNLNLVVGAHYLSIEERKPYSEFSVGLDNIGIGKFRMVRVDYVRSFYSGKSDSEIVLGLKFLNILGI